MLQYFASREIVFTFVTFLIGKESPCYSDTIARAGDNWDVGRTSINNPLPIIELIYSIFTTKKSNEKQSENSIAIELSERDLKCLKHPAFLKLIYKSSQQIFCDLMTRLNTNNLEFTKLSCMEITKFIDDITIYDEGETNKLVDCIIKMLEIEDEHQLLRFNILLGYPHLMVEEPNYKTSSPFFGVSLIKENQGRYIEIRGLYNVRNTSCLMKRIFCMKFREKTIIEIFLKLLNAARTNLFLLKYIRNFNAEEINLNE